MKKVKNNSYRHIYAYAFSIYSNVKYFFLETIYYPIKNLIFFWDELKTFRPWDHAYCVSMYTKSLDALCECLRNGLEEETSRMKKVEKIEELLWLLQNDPDDRLNEFQMAWEQKNNGETFSTYMQTIRSKREKEIFDILRGQSKAELERKYNKIIERMKKKHPDILKADEFDEYYKEHIEAFDGSGCVYWWD